MSKLLKSIYQIDQEETKVCLQSIMECDFATIDKNIKLMWKQVIAGYVLGIITDEQRQKLTEYSLWKEAEKLKLRDQRRLDKLKLLESYENPPEIYQLWLIDWRIVVASISIEHDWKKAIKKTNGKALVLYRDKTPRAYEYAQKNYQVHQEF